MVFKLKELKVLDYSEPIFLIGTVVLGFSPSNNTTFAYIGINPTTAIGEAIFYDSVDHKFIACELVYAPTTHQTLPDKTTKKVRFSEEKNQVHHIHKDR